VTAKGLANRRPPRPTRPLLLKRSSPGKSRERPRINRLLRNNHRKRPRPNWTRKAR
jgi:hypothetical protein